MEDARLSILPVGSSPDFSVVMKRNCSISPRALAWLLAVTAGLSFAIGIAFALFGAWPVLPFVGLEVAALALAFYVNGRHATDYERIALEDGLLVVEVRDADRLEAHRLNPRWAGLVVRGDRRGMQLALRSHGREIEIGRHLDGPGRETLAAALRGRLAPERRAH